MKFKGAVVAGRDEFDRRIRERITPGTKATSFRSAAGGSAAAARETDADSAQNPVLLASVRQTVVG